MGLKGSVCVALFLSLNLLSLSIVTSQPCPNMRVCVSDLLDVMVGSPPPTSSSACCGILQGLGVGASSCLCNSLRPSVLGVNLNLPLTNALVLNLNTTLNNCGVNLRGC
ncbi:hypothetical protein ACSQ67_019974 [Phaseolus vulgaris]